MRKIYLFCLISVVFIKTGQAQFAGGTGTASNPFQVATATHLNNVRNHLNTTSLVHFVQIANIDLAGSGNWVPIGGGGTTNIFNGVYNGNGHTISNLTINLPGTADVGLFGRVGPADQWLANASRIINLGLRNVNITGGVSVGALVGRIIGNEVTRIENCYVIGGTITGDANTGGLVGANSSYITDPEFDGRKPVIRNSFANVNVIISGTGPTNEKFGGLAGSNYKGRIVNSYSFSNVNVTGTASKVGGLTGCNDAMGEINNSYSVGFVSAATSVTHVGGLLGTQGTTAFSGTVTSSYWDTQTSGQPTSAGGEGRTTAQMYTQGNFTGWDFINIWGILENQFYPFLRTIDLNSGFNVALTLPGSKTAGESFNLSITDAINVSGVRLTGLFRVVVTTDVVAEKGVPNGEVFNQIVDFSNGGAMVAGVVLERAVNHTLTVSVATISVQETLPVLVVPAQATTLVIQQQPLALYTGNFNDQPVGLGTIVVVATDAFGNPSSAGLAPGQMVTATLENDGSPQQNALLGGVTQVSIATGTATFTGLTLDKNGSGYTLRFSSLTPTNLGFVISNPFSVQGVEDLSGFTASAGQVQHQMVPFQVQITGATNPQGASLTGSINVQVSSSLEGLIFNQNISFTAGNANFALVLEVLGAHNLTITVQGATETRTIPVTVEADQSGFTLDPIVGNRHAGIPFDLNIVGARNKDGVFITSARVTVTSNIPGDGVVFNQVVSNFGAGGNATIPITLITPTEPGSHILTVSIETITLPRTVSVVVVANVSGFSVTGPLVVDAGDAFNLSITNAHNYSGLLAGNFNVQVTSDKDGQVFNGNVTFTAGAAIFPVTINLAHVDAHILTVSVATIIPINTVNVQVVPNIAAALQIVNQDLGRTGNFSGTPVIIGTVTLRTVDKVGNPSVRGLSGTQNVVASLQFDRSTGGDASLAGTLTRNILPTGIVTFADLTLDRNGNGYVVRFTSLGPSDLGFVDTAPFKMAGAENLSGFDIVNPGPQVRNVPFTLNLKNARNAQGQPLHGEVTVLIERQSPAPIAILFYSTTTFSNGFASINILSDRNGPNNIDVSLPGNVVGRKSITISIVAADSSGFALSLVPPGPQTAGQPFGVQITNAKDKAGALLTGRNHLVTLSSSNSADGTNGLLYRDSLNFSGGAATIPNIILSTSGTRTLTVSIDWVTNPVPLPNVVVNAGPAVTFTIATQPVGGTGNFNDVPVPVGPVVLHFRDILGNLSSQGLGAHLTVTASIENGPPGATLGGTTIANIVDGVVIFNDLTLNRNGAYMLSFVYNDTLPPVFAPLISAEFNISNVEDLSGFLAGHPGRQYQNIPFGLVISGATDRFGAPLQGAINATVTSNLVAGVFNAPVTFTAGNGVVDNIVLGALGFHDLTVTITGVTAPVIVTGVEVVLDQSGFLLSLDPAAGPYYQFIPFQLVISQAKDRDGVDIDGTFPVSVSSNLDGVVFSGGLGFVTGAATTGIALAATGDHILTVTVGGVTNPVTITVFNVLSNQSGFDLALAVAGDKVAGENFDLSITNAHNAAGGFLQSTGHRVIVTSNLSGQIFDSGAVNFGTIGAATVTVNLTLAQLHTLTVSIAGIIPTREVPVNVVPAIVSKMVITTQPAGGVGNLDNMPVLIGNVVVQTFDAFDNPSTSGLSGTQQVTIAIGNNPSVPGVILGGTTVTDISTGTALFNNLTIDQEGVGFTLEITYNGTPALVPVVTLPFTVANIYITYTIAVNVTDPHDFGSATAGYAPITPLPVTITRTGSGNITNINATLGGTNPANFTLDTSTLTGVTLNALNPAATFTVVPNNALPPGIYSATVTVTADHGVVATFTITFTVLHSYLITLSSPNLTGGVVNFGTGTGGVYLISQETVTITRVGTGDITNLAVNLSGANPTAFTVTPPVVTTLDGTTVSTTFTVVPNIGLVPGSYSATVTVTAGNGVNEAFNVLFTVIAQHAISLNPVGNIDFGHRAPGYGAVAPVVVTITNIGANPITNISVTPGGTNPSAFAVTQPVPDFLNQTNDFTTFTVNPVPGLVAGTYTATVTVSATSLSPPVTFNVTFRVLDLFTWVGNTSDWHGAINWDLQQVPSGQVYITIPAIPSGGNNPVISNTNATIYNLTLQAGAQLTVNAARRLTVENQGSITVENNAFITSPGDLRIQPGSRMVLRPGARISSTGSLINNAGTDGLMLESSSAALAASLIHNSAGVQATVQRWISGRVFVVISPPVTGDRIESFLARNPISRNIAQGVHAMQVYNEVGGWSPFFPSTTTGPLEHGRAYSIRIGPSAGAVVSFRGTLRGDALSQPITRNLFGWNGVGNPFTSSIGITQAAVNGFLNDNLAQLDPGYAGIWVYDPILPGYRIINNIPQAGGFAQDFVALGQGFIIKARTGGGNITFNTGLRNHQQPPFLRNAPVPWPNIRLAAGVRNIDGTFRWVNTYVAFNNAMTSGLDVTYDAGMFEPDPNLMIYTRMPDSSSNLNLGVQALPDNFENMVVPVGFSYPAGGEVMFTTQSLSLPSGVDVILEDRLLNKFTNLAHDDYHVVLEAGSSQLGRFYLQFEEAVVFYQVYFGIEGTNGGIVRARVEQHEITSGSEVRRGGSIIFSAEPHSGFRLREWVVNGTRVEPGTGNVLVIDNLQEVLNVKALFEDITINVEDFRLEGFRVFVQDRRIYIHGPLKKNMRAILYDMNGRRILNERLPETERYSINVEGLMRGIYMLHLTGGERPMSVNLLVY